jgi:aspartyl/glutamyl-tRNA(Asn/Gln) amidotransferase C subunit
MMTPELNEETVKKIAALSRLELTEEEIKTYQAEMQKILHAFQDLANVSLPLELEGDARSALVLKQLSNSHEDISRMQEDKEHNSLTCQTFLAQSPDREGAFVRVPAILSSST